MVEIVKCDIFNSGCDIFGHQTNCHGVMGSGLALLIKQRFPDVYTKYRELCLSDNVNLMGYVQFVKTGITKPAIIANLFGQYDFGVDKRHTDYKALEKCFINLKDKWINTQLNGLSIALPFNLGCGYGGGNWNIVYDLIIQYFGNTDIPIKICKLEGA
jgi:O-acetyl-ADP-ribose deacetylase (regulator of RNase III)